MTMKMKVNMKKMMNGDDSNDSAWGRELNSKIQGWHRERCVLFLLPGNARDFCTSWMLGRQICVQRWACGLA